MVALFMTSRDAILNKLRYARRPFQDAAPTPQPYAPVTVIDDLSPESLLARFREEVERLDGEVYGVKGDDAARDQVLALLEEAEATRIASWHFKHIPVKKLYTAIQAAGYTVDYPQIHGDDREAELARLETAQVGLTGADAVIAATGTLVVTTGAGKSRVPTILPPVHIAVVRLNQFLPRLEDWVAQQRESHMATINETANACFITGPSRTADIEKQLVVGVHGPGKLQIVVKR